MSWYRSAVFYEVLARAFRDSNGDGIGDLAGLTAKLDYVQWLGVDCIWVPPIFESPLRDGGYDVSDFMSVHPDLGTVDDLRNLIDSAHSLGLRVISDMVVNHTSDAHQWFIESLDPTSDKADWYVWSDTPERWQEARVIFCDTEPSNWTFHPDRGQWYWHRFYSHQPDLNFDNPDVCDAMLGIVDHWLDFGFDGFRLDAVPYLYERDGTNGENLPETHEFLKRVRRVADRHPETVLLCEANQWPQDVVEYFGDGDECQMAFNFPIMPRLYMALARGHVKDLRAIVAATPPIPDGCQWGTFLRNHDELTLEMVTPEERDFMWETYAPDPSMRMNLGIRRRLAPLVDGDRRKIELLHGILLALPGSPVLYYGDEIGMGDEHLLHDRDGVRTPMQWNDSPGAGFSEADPATFYLPLVTLPGYTTGEVNVADQMDDPDSLLNWLRNLLAVRRGLPELEGSEGTIMADLPDEVFGISRPGATRAFIAVGNFSDRTVSFELPEGEYHDVVGAGWTRPSIELGPYEFRWFVRT